MEFKFLANPEEYHGTEDEWYALAYGGYIDPEKILADREQLEELLRAIDLVLAFFKQCEDAGIIGEEG